MKTIVFSLTVWGALMTLQPSPSEAHTILWRAGESRVVGVGHCAKGACMRRVYWGTSKPHRHVGGKVVFDRIVSATGFGS